MQPHFGTSLMTTLLENLPNKTLDPASAGPRNGELGSVVMPSIECLADCRCYIF
jgi:hypothetical protein